VKHAVLGVRRDHDKILRPVVDPIVIDVVDLFSALKVSTDCLFCNQPVFVDVSSGVC
jgi:hypothetical protein